MYKKTLLSVAIASALSLTGCLDTTDPENKPKERENEGSTTHELTEEQSTGQEQAATGTYPVFSPSTSELPIPNDLIFDSTAGDGTFAVPDSAPPVTTAINQLSGASTTAPIDIRLSDLVDPDSIKGRITDGPLQNVFLIELAYGSGNTVQALSAGEIPTIVPPSAVEYEASHIELDGESYVRINPIVPLKPDTRYVVVVTDGITDDEGNPIIRDPGIADYAAITDETRDLANPALEPVRSLINGLWEPIALNYFANATNLQRAQASLDPLTADNITLSYSFTTSGDEKVLNYIADPAQWFADQITRFVGISTAQAVLAGSVDVATTEDGNVVYGPDGSVDYADIKFSVDSAIAAFPANPSNPEDTAISDALAPIAAAFPFVGCTDVTAGSDFIDCVATVLTSLPSSQGGFADLLPTPAATEITFDDTATMDIYQVSSLPASLMEAASVPPGTVSVTQGNLTIPYYLGQPSGDNGLPLITDSWVADDTLATAINTAFAPLGLSIPQADPEVSTAVNYIFPFPKSTGDVTIPIIAVHPTNPAGDMSTVMWQHGITTDRSTALTFGGSLVAGAKLSANADVAVIAIDQPLHGIDGYSDADRAILAESLLVTAEAISDDEMADGQSDDAAAQFAIDGVVAGTYAETVVISTLSDNALIDTSDGISETEQALIDSAFTSELTDNVVIGGLTQAAVIDPTDGLDATELAYIDAVYAGTFAETFVTGELAAATVIDISNGIDATEQATIDAVLAGASGNPALASLEAGAASLLALQGAAQALPELESGAQSLALLQRTVMYGSSQIPGLDEGSDSERHFGFTANAVSGAEPLAMDYEGTALANRSGSMFINFTSFMTSRDNLRQQVLDLLAVRKSIGSIDLNPSAEDGADLDADDVYFIGHSLGTINGIPFVAVANDSTTTSDNIVAANFLTPGGGISRFFENSPVFAPAVVDGLAAQGFTQDTSNYQAFINTLQASLDSIDPINFVADFAGTTPVLFTEAVDDVFIPNSVATEDEVLGGGSISYLAGTEPLATISGASTLSASGPLTQNIVRFTHGVHETPVFPLTGTDEEKAAYAEMVSQATSMVVTGGTAISVTTTEGIVE